jgi:hypothetical protein
MALSVRSAQVEQYALRKFVPVTLSMNAAPQTVAEAGLRLAIDCITPRRFRHRRNHTTRSESAHLSFRQWAFSFGDEVAQEHGGADVLFADELLDRFLGGFHLGGFYGISRYTTGTA